MVRGSATKNSRAKAIESLVLGLSRLQADGDLVISWFVSALFGSI